MSAISPVLLAQVLGEENGPGMNVNVPWQVVAVAIVVLVVLLAIAAVVLLIMGRRPGRLPLWRRKRLELEETVLGEGPRRALVRLRLQLDEAMAVARSAASGGAADVGDLRLLVQRLDAATGRIAAQIDSLIGAGAGADNVPKRVVEAIRARVRDIESVASSIADAASATVAGSTAVEIEALTEDVRDQLELVDARTQALRELSGRPEPER